MKHSFVILLGIWLAGCSSVSVRTDFDRERDFTGYRVYKWDVGKSIPGDPLAKHPPVRKQIVDAIDATLAKKGISKVESGDADFVVVVHAGVRERIQIANWGQYGWYYPWWGPYGGRVEVSNYDEGTLVIDIVDTREKTLIWRGLGTSIVRDYSSENDLRKKINDVVERILADFPPGTK